jgi:uncharacterized Zn-finger protein
MPQARICLLERIVDCEAAKRIIMLVEPSAVRANTHTISRSHMGPFETIYINETIAACNGGGGALGHPRVFLNLGRDGKVECPNRAMQEPAGGATTPPKVSEERNA